MIKNWEKFNKSKLDYYYLEYEVDLSIIREIYNLVEKNNYRGFATFGSNIKYFLELPCAKIALLNYPPERYTKQNLVKQINEVKSLGIDEIEFVWNPKYKEWDKQDWRDIILDCSINGIRLRPMLEMAVQSEEDIIETINFLREIGIYSIMSSTGLIPEIVDIYKWNELKYNIPKMFETKIVGTITNRDLDKLNQSDVDLSATTIDFKKGA